jgi:hypothetical protein
MANLLFAAGTSFSPLLVVAPEDWAEYCANDVKREVNRRDGTAITYDELRAQTKDKFADQTTLAEFQRRAAIAADCLERIRAELAAAKPDAIVAISDDHGELFDSTNCPAVAVYRAAELANSGGAKRTMRYLGKGPDEEPQWRRNIQTIQTIHPDRHYPGHPQLAESLVRGLIDRKIDVAVADVPQDLATNGIGYAWGFVINRLIGERQIPIVPVMLNTWYPPNVPTPERCYEIGQALHGAILDAKPDLRVAVVCGGGLSHVGIDEELDRTMLEAARIHDKEALRKLPREALFSGSCQLLNWIVLAGLAHSLDNKWLEYLPVYRTPAGTGIGLAFGSWS